MSVRLTAEKQRGRTEGLLLWNKGLQGRDLLRKRKKKNHLSHKIPLKWEKHHTTEAAHWLGRLPSGLFGKCFRQGNVGKEQW